MKRPHILILLCIFFLGSCERYQDIELDIPYKKKLVAVTFLEEGASEVRLFLTHSVPLTDSMGHQAAHVPGAEVYLHTPSESVMLVFDEQDQQYAGMLSEPVSENTTYRLSVKDHDLSVSGSCTVPAAATPVLVSGVIDSIFENESYTYTVKFRVKIKETGRHNLTFSVQQVYNDSSRYPMERTDYSITVAQLNTGEETEMSFKTTFWAPTLSSTAYFEVTPLLCDEPYTRYHNTMALVPYSGFGSYLEPAIPYSNMSNRVGVIGSYRTLPSLSIPMP